MCFASHRDQTKLATVSGCPAFHQALSHRQQQVRRRADTSPSTSNRCSARLGDKLCRRHFCCRCVHSSRVADNTNIRAVPSAFFCVLLVDGAAGAVTTAGYAEDAHVLQSKTTDGVDAEGFEDTMRARLHSLNRLFVIHTYLPSKYESGSPYLATTKVDTKWCLLSFVRCGPTVGFRSSPRNPSCRVGTSEGLFAHLNRMPQHAGADRNRCLTP